MDPFYGFAVLAMAILVIIGIIIVISAIITAFQGNFVGLLLIIFIIALSATGTKKK